MTRASSRSVAGRFPRCLSIVALAALVLALPVYQPASAGREEPHDASTTEFTADANADVYAGPAPLTVKFTASAVHAVGRLR